MIDFWVTSECGGDRMMSTEADIAGSVRGFD